MGQRTGETLGFQLGVERGEEGKTKGKLCGVARRGIGVECERGFGSTGENQKLYKGVK